MLVKVTLITLALSTIANFGLAFVAYRKNPLGRINQLFALLCLSIIGWSTADFFGNGHLAQLNSSQTFLAFRLIFTFLTLQNLFFFLLLKTFPGPRLKMNRVLAILLGAISLIIATAPFAIGNIFVTQMGDMIMPGPGMMVFMIFQVFFIIAGFTVVIRRVRGLSGQAKNQARYLLIATLLLWLAMPISEFVLPTLFGLNFSYAISPVIALLFAITIAYAIIRQRLFDIRPVAARSLSYGLFLVTLVIAYILVAFGVSALFMHK